MKTQNSQHTTPRFLPGWGLVVFFLLLGAQPTLAQEAVSFQGRLMGPDSVPVNDGSHAVRFQLFDDETGGSAQWEETHTVTTTDGVFSVLLGTENTLNLDAFDERPYLLLIVENEEMEPRVPLTAVPYAMKSYRLDEAALVAGANVSITQRSDGALQIGATGGGGGTGGLTSVATDATLTGNGTSGAPLGLADGSVTGVKLANNAIVAGQNVDIVRRGNGSWEISAASGGGGLAQVASDATLTGEGTPGSPLGLADGSVTEQKLADGSVTGAKVSVPLVLTGSGASGVIHGENANGNYGELGTQSVGVFAENSNGPFGYLAQHSMGAFARNPSANTTARLAGSNYAGDFQGDVQVTGTLSKGGGAFKIDHPLDPASKYLSHSFVESPDMKNVYDGNVTTDVNGEAIVTLPDYFEALNRDFRYQLTVIGQFAQAIVAEEIQGNQFVIRTDAPHVKVSWLVTGIRQDAWAEENRIVVEEVKSAKEQGFYLHPTLFGQPQQHSVEWARDPEMMRERQEMSAQSETKPVSRPRQQ